MTKYYLFFICFFGFFQSASGENFYIDDYGAIGDGVTDDRGAFDLAVKDLLESTDESNELNLGINKTYRLIRSSDSENREYIFDLSNQENITINGNGSLLDLDRYDLLTLINNSSNISIKNIKVDYNKPTFTQGTITSHVDIAYDIGGVVYEDGNGDGIIEVLGQGKWRLNDGCSLTFEKDSNFDGNPDQLTYTGSFKLTLDDGYPLPTVTENLSNSSTFSSSGDFLRINIFVDKVNINKQDLSIISSNNDLCKLEAGQKFAFRAHGGSEPGHQIEINRSHDIALENVSIYNTMKMAINGKYNTGTLDIKGLNIIPRPGTGRLLSAVSDGIHLKSNRAEITITDSLIERNLDDAINLGSMAEVLHAIHSTEDIEIRDASFGGESVPLDVGDEIYAFNFEDGQVFLGKAIIKTVDPVNVNGNTNRVRRVTLNKPILGMTALKDPDKIFPGGNNLKDWSATRFFIPDVSNTNFKIMNNIIRDKVRSGMLVKGKDGIIRGNSFSNLDGYGIYAANNIDFNEGPFPMNMEISANKFQNIGLWGILAGISVKSFGTSNPVVINTDIVNNYFEINDTSSVESFATKLKIVNVSGVNLSGNTFSVNAEESSVESCNSSHISASTVLLCNSQNIQDVPFLPIRKISNEIGLYLVSNDSYCRYGSISRLIDVWGEDYRRFISLRT